MERSSGKQKHQMSIEDGNENANITGINKQVEAQCSLEIRKRHGVEWDSDWFVGATARPLFTPEYRKIAPREP